MKDESKFIESLINPETRDLSFEKLFHSSPPPLSFHIRKIVLNHDDAHDVLQKPFLPFFPFLSNFKFESKLYTWIYRIATNESLNFIKSKAKKFLMTSEEMMTYQINNLKEDPYFDGNELQISLQKAINSLPTKQKLVFQMKYEQDMKFKEIAEILEISEGGLKASYHIAVKKIKKELIENQTF